MKTITLVFSMLLAIAVNAQTKTGDSTAKKEINDAETLHAKKIKQQQLTKTPAPIEATVQTKKTTKPKCKKKH
jgi:Na+-transporting methylmalonyl-CoA/oxaloacetate decarboxylase gamma subunit